MEGSSIGTEAKGWEFLYFPVEFLKGFLLGSIKYLDIAGCPTDSSATPILPLPPYVNISAMAYLGLLVPVSTSLSPSSPGHIKGEARFYVANPT